MRAFLFLLHSVVTTTTKMTGDAILSALWRLNVYDVNMTRLLFDATELGKFLLFNHAKLPEIEYKSFVYFSALCNNTILQM